MSLACSGVGLLCLVECALQVAVLCTDVVNDNNVVFLQSQSVTSGSVLLLQELRVNVGDFVEINLSEEDVEHYAVMEITELFEDIEVCQHLLQRHALSCSACFGP